MKASWLPRSRLASLFFFKHIVLHALLLVFQLGDACTAVGVGLLRLGLLGGDTNALFMYSFFSGKSLLLMLRLLLAAGLVFFYLLAATMSIIGAFLLGAD